MNLLAIDTSTDTASVALAVQGEIYTEEQSGMRQHAQFLLPMIERMLALADLSCQQLDAIVFGRGPGSFTGLRIACSVAKGLAYAHDLPMYPVSGLAAIANEAGLNQPVLALMDARMHQVYWAYFDGDSGDVLEQVSNADAIYVPSDRPFTLAGIGFEPYLAQLPASINAQISQQCTIVPNAKTMIRMVEAGYIKPVSAEQALPVYVRNQVTQGGESRG